MSYITKTLTTSEGCDASQGKRLSICLLADGFSFAQLSHDGELLAFGEAGGGHAQNMTDAARELKAWLTGEGIRPLQFGSMQLTVFSNASVWVPDEVYQPGMGRQYLKLVGGDGQGLMTAQCPELGSTAVFAASDWLATAFKVSLPGLTVANQHVRLAEVAGQMTGSPVLLTHWRDGYVDIAAYRDGRYVFGNTWAGDEEGAVLFHLLDVMKTYGLESEGTRLLMCGDVDRERFARFRPYFPVVSLWGGTAKAGGKMRTLHTYRHALTLVV